MRLDEGTPTYVKHIVLAMMDIMFYRRDDETLFEQLRVLFNAMKEGSVQKGWIRSFQTDYMQASLGNACYSRFGSSMAQPLKLLVVELARFDINGILQRGLVQIFRMGEYVLFFWFKQSRNLCLQSDRLQRCQRIDIFQLS